MLWSLNLLDAQGHATSEAFGNGLWVQNAFDPLTGLATTRKAGTGGQESNIQSLSYQWDPAGNVTSRQDLRQGLLESFGYDALDRLTTASGPGGVTSIGYDAIGNITNKTGIAGTFTYHPTRRHAVTSAGGTSYSYDANGNMTSRAGATIAWSSYNLPTTINAPNGTSAQFAYTPDRARWRQISAYAGGTETTIYVGGLLEKLTTSAGTRWKHSIPTPSGQVQVVRRSDGTSETLYVVTDHLGSTEAVLDAAGGVLMRASFDVHGARRGSNWQGTPTTGDWQAIEATTRDGYTGHEMLDNVNLIHMNGRVFDPAIGRFLSADPFIDGAYSTQGWNRYAYVHGRVLSATDPSGYGFCQRVCYWSGIEGSGIEGVTVQASRLSDWVNTWSIGSILDQLSPLATASGTEGTITADVIEEIVDEKGAEGRTNDKCWRPYGPGESFVGEYVSRVANLTAGVLDSINASGELGFQVSGKVNLGPILNATATFGVINFSAGTSAALNLQGTVRVPEPGSWVYGEASLGAGNTKIGVARDSVVDGISVRRGPYEDYEEGFFFKPATKLGDPQWGKVGVHLQAGIGGKIELDFAKAWYALDCAFE